MIHGSMPLKASASKSQQSPAKSVSGVLAASAAVS
jgi:hypothetical protein